MAKEYYSTQFKLDVLFEFENRESTIKEFCSKFQITKNSLMKWMNQF